MIIGDHKDTLTGIRHMLVIIDETHSETLKGTEMDALYDE